MTSFREWLANVLERGESAQTDPPALPAADRGAIESLLRAAYHTHSLTVSGPLLPIDLPVAVDAALTLADACWLLVNDDRDAAPPKERLRPATTASAHLSADLTLRLLPAVYRRIKSRRDDDPLVGLCEKLFRRWPLSGVLAGLADGPESLESLDLFGHVGLQLLYAERLVAHPHSAWVPTGGRVREQVDRVFHQHRKPVPKPVPALESAS